MKTVHYIDVGQMSSEEAGRTIAEFTGVSYIPDHSLSGAIEIFCYIMALTFALLS